MIGERLAEVRKDHGDTQAALAKRLRVTLSAVRSWEQEKKFPLPRNAGGDMPALSYFFRLFAGAFQCRPGL